MVTMATPGSFDAPECCCRELGEFKPFAAFWLAEGGGVPTSRTPPASDDHFNEDWMEHETCSSSEDVQLGDKYWLLQSHRDGTAVEEQMFVRGCKMVWSCGQSVVTSLSMPTPVIQVVCCSFSQEAHKSFRSSDEACYPVYDSQYLCVLMERELAIYAPAGDVFSVALPFRAAEMWETRGTLLLRAAEDEGTQTTPMLFSLLHPLEDPRPLRASKPGEEQAQLFTNTSMQVEYVSSGTELELWQNDVAESFVVTYDRTNGRRTLWALRFPVGSDAAEGQAAPVPSDAARQMLLAEEGDAVAMVHSNSHGWVACGSIGLGADMRSSWAGAKSDVAMLGRWQSAQAAECAAETAFLVSDPSAQVQLAVLMRGSSPAVHLYALQIGGGGRDEGERRDGAQKTVTGLHLLCAIPALAAAPIVDESAVRPANLLAVLAPDRCVRVYMGHSALLQLSFNLAAQPIAGLAHAVAGRVNLVLEDGSQLRVEVPSVSCLLTRRCLMQARTNLSLDTYLCIRKRLLRMEWGRQRASNGQVRDSPGGEWGFFASVMQSLMEDAGLEVCFDASPDQDGLLSPEEMSERIPEGEQAWEQLLATDYHRQFVEGGGLDSTFAFGFDAAAVAPAPRIAARAQSAPAHGSTPWAGSAEERKQELQRALRALHCLYEDMKLDLLVHEHLPRLGRLLTLLAYGLGAHDHCDYYLRHHSEMVALLPAEPERPVPGGFEEVPDIYKWMCERVDGFEVSSSDFADPGGRILPRTEQICCLYSCLVGDLSEVESRTPQAAAELEKLKLQQERLSPAPTLLTSAQLLRQQSGMNAVNVGLHAGKAVLLRNYSGFDTPARSLPRVPGFLSPTEDSMEEEVASKPVCETLVEKMVELGIRLHDIDKLPLAVALPIRECLWACRAEPPKDWTSEAYSLVAREDLASPVGLRAIKVTGSDPQESVGEGGDADVLRGRGARASLAAAPGESGPQEGANADGTRMEGEFARLRFGKDRRLVEVRRCLSAATPVRLRIPADSEVTDHDVHAAHQARLQLLARRTLALAVGRGMFTLATATPLPTEGLPIPALQLGGRLPTNDALIKLDSTQLPADHTSWPEFHNGVAAALRLSLGQTAISRTWIVYNKPEQANYAHAGVLMGLGLQGHLKALAKTDLYSYLCQDHEATQIGIMLGMAASKRGTMDEAVFKMLYVHIPSLHPPNYPDLEVSSVVQSAAVLGIGLLYQGSKHRRMAEVLLAEIGRRATNDRLQDREGYSLAAGMALGLVILGQGNSAAGLSDLHIENKLRKYMTGGKALEAAQAAQAATDPTLCCRIKEGENVNVDVTAPGATLALGLMFLKTNSASVAARLEVPNTNFLLQYVRPDLVLLRVLSRSLVLWDSIAPTAAWVEAQMPQIVKNAAADFDSNNILSGSGKGPKDEAGSWVEDRDTLRHVHANIVAGCCLAIGLRYAGSGEKRAKDLLISYLAQFQAKRARCEGFRKVDKQLMENCIGIAAISASLVMAGTGDVELLRICRGLRERVDGDLQYGQHMAVGIAVGFLFLGGGRATLCTSNEAIAALIISLYPRVPISTSDCRYHLQAFRHLYVLAVEHRCLETVDVQNNQACMVPVEILLEPTPGYDETVLHRVTPCILPELGRVRAIQVSSSRYWGVRWDIGRDSGLAKALCRGCVLHVLRKTGHLSYVEDPAGLRNLLARSFPRRPRFGGASGAAAGLARNNSDFVKCFSGDPAVLGFARHLCFEDLTGQHSTGSAGGEGGQAQAAAAAFCTEVLYECLTREKPEALQAYAELYDVTRGLERRQPWAVVADLRLLLCYYALLSPRPRPQRWPLPLLPEPLLSHQFLIRLRAQLESHLKTSGVEAGEPSPLQAYIQAGRFPSDPRLARSLSAFLLFHGVPNPSRLQRAREAVAGAVSRLGGASAVRHVALPIAGTVMCEVPPATAIRIAPYLLP